MAGTPSNSNNCIYIGNPTASDVFHLQGSTTINATNCNIYVNSNSASAVKITGNSSTVSAGVFDVVGGYSGHQTSPTPITTSSATQSNPFGNITGPTPPGACTTTSAATTVAAGAAVTTAGGVVCFTNAVTLNNGVNMSGASGGTVYVFENGVTIATGATVTFGSGSVGSATNGAVIDLYGGTLNQNSNSILNSFAPTQGTYNGISILQPLSNTTTPLQVQFGSNNETLDGMIYAPGVEVYLQDNGGGVTASGVFANTMFIKSSSLTIPSYSAANAATTPSGLFPWWNDMEIDMTNQKRNRRMKGHLGREGGQALVEAALTMPIMILLLVGAAELARVAYAAVEVSNAAKAAVAYGARTPTQSTDVTGMQTAAAADASDLTATLTTTASTAGICSSGNSCTGAHSSCTNTDCSTPGDHIEWILTVQTSATFDPAIHLPWIPTTFLLRGQALYRRSCRNES